jgi:hypothetical protein
MNGMGVLDYLDGENWDDRARRIGNLCGYPDCCIDEFIKRDWDNRPKRKFHGTGYVPCEACNEKSGLELIATINEKRTFNTPFPFAPWDK